MFTAAFFDLQRTPFPELWAGEEPVWAALAKIGPFLQALALKSAPSREGAEVSPLAFVGEQVWLGAGVVVEPGAVIKGPGWIGANCQVRAGAYVRENVIAGAGSVLGNSCEFKNCVLGEKAEVPHFNYVGDSLLGGKAHLGAGVILSNVRLDRGLVSLQVEGERVATGLKKFGAVIGDDAEIGCNSVISPGSLIGPRSILYPGCLWRGVLGSDQLVKVRQEQEVQSLRSKV